MNHLNHVFRKKILWLIYISVLLQVTNIFSLTEYLLNDFKYGYGYLLFLSCTKDFLVQKFI